MIKAVAKFLGLGTGSGQEPPQQHRRIFPRRANDLCVSVIDGKLFPVENWSMGGMLLAGDSRLFGVNQTIDITLKFRLREEILDIGQKARIIRKSEDRFALEFANMNDIIKTKLQQVIDDQMMREMTSAPV